MHEINEQTLICTLYVNLVSCTTVMFVMVTSVQQRFPLYFLHVG